MAHQDKIATAITGCPMITFAFFGSEKKWNESNQFRIYGKDWLRTWESIILKLEIVIFAELMLAWFSNTKMCICSGKFLIELIAITIAALTTVGIFGH